MCFAAMSDGLHEDYGLLCLCSVPESHQHLALVMASQSFFISLWCRKHPENARNPSFTKSLSEILCHSLFPSGRTSYIHGSQGSMIVLAVRVNFFFLNQRFLVFSWLEKIFFFFSKIFDFWLQKLCFDHPFLCSCLRHLSGLGMLFVCLCSFICLFLTLFPGGRCIKIRFLRVHLSNPLSSSCKL